MYQRILKNCSHIFQGGTTSLWRQIDYIKELTSQKHLKLLNKKDLQLAICMVGVVKYLPILVSGVKDWPLEGAVRLLSPLLRTGTKGKELREAEVGKHNW